MGYQVATRRVFGAGGYQVVARSTAASVVPFAPSDLSGGVGWYKADALVFSNGAAVPAWADSFATAHDLAQVTGASQPIYNTNQQNSLPAVTLDGINDYMATAAFASPTAGYTVMAVVKQTPANAYRVLLNHAAQATWAAPYSRVLVRLTDDAGAGGVGQVWQTIVEDAAVGANLAEETTIATSTWQIMEFVYDQANIRIRRNGTQVATTVRTGLMTATTRAVFLGVDTDLGEPFKGQIGELVYYSRGLNSTELGQVRTYLQTKWGL